MVGARPIALVAAAFLVAASFGAFAETASLKPSDVVSERGLPKFVKVDRLPAPEHPVLARGRSIWGETCFRCHGGDGLTGAPKVTSLKAWRPRVAKGLDLLFTHAIEGFIGPDFEEMPSRGGDSDLSDAEVMSAVAFMVWTSGGQAEVEAWLNSHEGELK